jgi:hypothetical protein
MKKFIVSILAILYLSTSMGATIHLHYCMGKLVDWGIWESSGSKCSNCGMEKSHNSRDQGCCKDEFKQIKNDKDQKLTNNFAHLSKTVSEVAPLCFPNYSISLPVISLNEIPNANAPPRSCTISLNIINCVFQI